MESFFDADRIQKLIDFGNASDVHSNVIFCPIAAPTNWFWIIIIGGTEKEKLIKIQFRCWMKPSCATPPSDTHSLCRYFELQLWKQLSECIRFIQFRMSINFSSIENIKTVKSSKQSDHWLQNHSLVPFYRRFVWLAYTHTHKRVFQFDWRIWFQYRSDYMFQFIFLFLLFLYFVSNAWLIASQSRIKGTTFTQTHTFT